MKIIYDKTLPYAVNRAIEEEVHKYHDEVGSFLKANEPFDMAISVTTLNKTPREHQLFIRHNKEIEVEARRRLHMLDGSLFHLVLESYPEPGCIQEKRFGRKLKFRKGDEELTILVHGKLDWLKPEEKWLSDHKRAQASKFLFEKEDEVDDYTFQLNALRWLVAKEYTVTKVTNFFSIKDWRKADAEKDQTGKYPKESSFYKERAILTDEVFKRMLHEKVKRHVQARAVSDTELPFCSDEERWQRNKYKVIKKTLKGEWSKVGCGTFGEEKEANQFGADLNQEFKVEAQTGIPRKCLDYCDCVKFCNQRQEEIKNQKHGTIVEED